VISDRKKPGVAFWSTVVVVVVLVAYPLSFGPACWIMSHLHPEQPGQAVEIIPKIYWPILVLAWHAGATWDCVQWYASVGAKDDWRIVHHRGRFTFAYFPPA
jgi:hypothetical protein